MFTRRIGAACETAQKSPEDRQSARPVTLIVRFDSERQKLTSAMQLFGGQAPVVDVDVAVDGDVGRRRAQAGHLGVVAHLEVERVGRRAVRAGLEQQRVALRAHLVVDLLGGDGVDGRLDLARRHAGIEDVHVRAEVRPIGRGDRRLQVGGRNRCQGGARRRCLEEEHSSEGPEENDARELAPAGDVRRRAHKQDLHRNSFVIYCGPINQAAYMAQLGMHVRAAQMALYWQRLARSTPIAGSWTSPSMWKRQTRDHTLP